MTIREVLKYPDKRLRQKSELVTDFNTAQLVIDDLLETMNASGHSVGIAAPQIGMLLRIVVIDCSIHVKKSLGQLVLVNPIILETEGSYSMREGCMSLPDYLGQVTRPRRIRVQSQDRYGERFEFEAKKFESIVIQHEIDHLEGILFIDKVLSKTGLLRRSEILRSKKKKDTPQK